MVGRPRTNPAHMRPDDLLTREQAKEVARFMADRDTVPEIIPGIVSEDPSCDPKRLNRWARLRAWRILSDRDARARARLEKSRAEA